MAGFIVRRLIGMVALLFVVSAVTFVVFTVLPSADPAVLRAGRQPTPAIIEQIREDLGLDRPKIVQFFDYVGDVFLHADLGRSYVSGRRPVLDEILDNLPATLWLTAGGVLVWLTFGLSIGILSAVRHRSIFDRVAIGLSLIAVSAPVYWLGLVSLYLFSPDGGAFGLEFLGGQGAYQIGQPLGERIQALVLPWLVIAASFAAVYSRLMRGSLLDVLGEDYIRTARAKGLPESRVIMRHGVRSAVTPVVTVLGLDVGILLGGAILTETVFNIPGVGRLAYDSITRGDLPMIQGTVLFGAFFIVVMNLLVDIAYAYLDPRVRR
jgi:peptide/nickel transport system permease protein